MKDCSTRVALIGCGRIAGHHCGSIVKTVGAELVAVCDLEISKARAYRDQYGVPAYSNYRQMLDENPEINTVAIITPSGMHYEHSLDILENYHKNIIVEKPLFMKPSQIRRVYDAADRFDLNIFPVFQNRHNLAVQRVKQGMTSGELGKVRVVAVRVRWCRPQRYYELAPWRGTYAMDGGCLTNQGIHHVDLMRYLGGEVDRVNSLMRTLGADIEVEDTAVGTVLFANGAVGNLEVTTAARPDDFEASLSLVCEKGLAQIGGIAVNELQIYTPDPSACASYSEDFSGNVYGHGHEKLYQEIMEFFEESKPFSVSYEDALATTSLLNAFYVSDEKTDWNALDSQKESIRLGRPDESLANLYRTPPFHGI